MSNPYSSITLAEYNNKVGTQPYALTGIISQQGNFYCANCADHVLVYAQDPEVTAVFKDQTDFFRLCVGCDTFVCNCKGCN